MKEYQKISAIYAMMRERPILLSQVYVAGFYISDLVDDRMDIFSLHKDGDIWVHMS